LLKIIHLRERVNFKNLAVTSTEIEVAHPLSFLVLTQEARLFRLKLKEIVKSNTEIKG
jgi:hypothetical protein